MSESLVLLGVLAFSVWFTVKVSRFVWRATDPKVLAEMRTRSAMARMEREREAQRRLEGK